jgi:predicted transcriptional regulator
MKTLEVPIPPNEASGDLLRLTRYELEIMDVLWRLGGGTVREVCNGLLRPLAYTSVMTTLSRLEQRKHVLEKAKEGRSFVYRPRVTRDEASRSILRDLSDVLFEGSLPSLVHSILAYDSVTPSDIAIMLEAISRLEKDR